MKDKITIKFRSCPRFSEIEVKAMTALVNYAICSNADDCWECPIEKDCHASACYVTKKNLSDALTTVRKMLSEGSV